MDSLASAYSRLSPDGTVVALGHTLPRKDVALVPARGGLGGSLCDDCELGGWATDGSHIILLRGNRRQLWIRDIRTGRETPLASHAEWNLMRPRFSPDGRWIAFHTANSPTLPQIYAVPAGTGAAIAQPDWIPIVTDFGTQPSWSPNGHGVYYFSLRDGAFCAWLQPLDPATMRPAGEPRVVQHLHEPRFRAVTGAIVTNDVRRGYLYATLTQTTGNTWIMRSQSPQRSTTR